MNDFESKNEEITAADNAKPADIAADTNITDSAAENKTEPQTEEKSDGNTDVATDKSTETSGENAPQEEFLYRPDSYYRENPLADGKNVEMPISNVPQFVPKKRKYSGLVAAIASIVLLGGCMTLSVLVSRGTIDLKGIGVSSSSESGESSETSENTESNEGSESSEFTYEVSDKPQESASGSANGVPEPYEVAEKVSPTVVVVEAGTNGLFSSYLSGTIISDEGYILTNAHGVVGCDSFKVTLSDEKVYTAKSLGYDSDMDIAVLKIEVGEDEKLPVAEIGDSDKLKIGERVYAIGNNSGLVNSFSGGFVSGLREMDVDDNRKATYIQTDAAANKGNSGGPLVNEYGQVIGIIFSGIRGTNNDIQDTNFAIPINTAMETVKDIIEGKYAPEERKFRVGITFNEISQEYAEENGVVPGLFIQEIDPNCDIAKSELKTGDIICTMNGKSVASTADIEDALRGKKAGDTVTADVVRMDILGNYDEFQIRFKLMPLE